jgi:hypothetical protein
MHLTRIQYIPKITHRALRAGDGSVRQAQSLEASAAFLRTQQVFLPTAKSEPFYRSAKTVDQLAQRSPSSLHRSKGGGDGNQKNDRLLRNVKPWLAFNAVPA